MLRALFVALVVLSACGKDEARRPAPSIPDHVTVLGHHVPPKPSDPVRIEIDRFHVVRAAFDPQTIVGGTATLELDLSSLHSGSAERDDDLKSSSFLDVASFGTITIAIDHVAHAQGTSYTADATVNAHGLTKTYPITFDVIAGTSSSIQIAGKHSFGRLDFAIGADPAQDPTDQVGTDVTIDFVITVPRG
jgi:polyisoprenoid-binding protein YceI